MKHKYKVQPIPTINLPHEYPDLIFLNYELYIGDGEIVDVRTRRRMGQPPEILVSQVIDLDGNFVRRLSPQEIELPPYPLTED